MFLLGMGIRLDELFELDSNIQVRMTTQHCLHLHNSCPVCIKYMLHLYF